LWILFSAESYSRTGFVQNRVSRMITYCRVIRALVKTVVMSDFLFGFVKTGEGSGPYAMSKDRMR